MKPVIIIAIAFVLIAGVSVTSISAQSQYDIPSWVKEVAGFWVEDKISDDDFGEGLAFLIDNEIIKVPIIQELESKINQIQSENNILKGEITNLKSQNTDLQNKLNQLTTSSTPKSSSEITSKLQSDLNYPKVTKRINGEAAGDTLTTLSSFYNSLTSSEKNELANRTVDQSQFTIVIVFAGNWILTVMEGNFDFTDYEGTGMSVLPFDCSHNPDYIYSIVGQKEDESGTISLWLFKNGVLIDYEKSEKSYGISTLADVCDESHL